MEGLPLSFDPKIFLFSLVNFAILFFVLKKFLFAPIYKILEERKSKIKDGFETIKQASAELETAKEEKNKIISNAGKESKDIIKNAEAMKKEILNKSKTEAEDIIKSSRNSIEKEREEIKKEMSSLLIDLVSAATDKALLNIGKQENQKKLVETAILQSLKESKIEMDEKK
ncbi:ATP synthase F0 subunit B [Candidatus Falkowbacteria bacterium RBG_13_39_14]|uniref:ATP synthase subunit b n=1 Tax=Candidatus Falkowbacteria bacterium RBG_13_39_14 TaxID=1797985 RepID=A0A1F5S2I2_9BACT|nr:MAG: ATP synthase F0 subunit B [Candidatus Falkowbacteria bacterium RBG_13_39_14]